MFNSNMIDGLLFLSIVSNEVSKFLCIFKFPNSWDLIKQSKKICFTCELADLYNLSCSSWVAMLFHNVSKLTFKNYTLVCKQEQRSEKYFLPFVVFGHKILFRSPSNLKQVWERQLPMILAQLRNSEVVQPLYSVLWGCGHGQFESQKNQNVQQPAPCTLLQAVLPGSQECTTGLWKLQGF